MEPDGDFKTRCLQMSRRVGSWLRPCFCVLLTLYKAEAVPSANKDCCRSAAVMSCVLSLLSFSACCATWGKRTVLLVHLILRISPNHSHHLRSHHPSLPLPFTPDLKLVSFTNPFLYSHSYSFRTEFTDLNRYWIKGSLFVCFSFWLRVLD